MDKQLLNRIYEESDKNFHLIAEELSAKETKEVFLAGVAGALMLVNALQTFDLTKDRL